MFVMAGAAGLMLLAAAPASEESLTAPPLPGFVVGYSAANAEQSIREEVPQGETVQAWTRMITTQKFAGVAERLTPADYLGIVAEALPRSCPGGKTTPVGTLTVLGRSAARIRADCPLLAATGKPETFFMLAIAGASDMHVKQVAFRRLPSRADEAFVAEFLSGVRLCGGTGRQTGC